ncbi:unnamed protein product [Caretta caretta]
MMRITEDLIHRIRKFYQSKGIRHVTHQEKIQAHLKTLRKEREKLLGFKVTGEEKFQEYLVQTQTKRQKIVSEFQQLRQFLEEQERLLLAQLEKLDKEIVDTE